MRAEFDKNKDIKDLRDAKDLLKKGEPRLSAERNWSYRKFALSLGGCPYKRELPLPGWLLDYWDPMEKAMFPNVLPFESKRLKNMKNFF